MSVIGLNEDGKLTLGQKTLGERAQEAGAKAKTEISQIRMPDFLLFAMTVYSLPAPGLGMPFNQVMVFVLVAYSLTRPAPFKLGRYSSLFAFLGILLGYVALLSMMTEASADAADWFRRWARLLATTFLILVIAQGRLHLRSAILGFSAGLLVNAALFYAGVAPNNYGGVLTGYLLDKNYAGLVHAIFAMLVITALEKRWHQVVVLVLAGFLLWETGSRTSLTALGLGYIWVLLTPKMTPLFKVGLLAGFWWLQEFLTKNFADAEVFGDREGSDALRERIDEWSWAKVQETGFFGQGLGEAYVYSEDGARTWFFHNSYWSAFVEGGWLWAVGLVAITLLFVTKPLSTNPGWSSYEILGQGLGLVILMCALRLGEVFYTLPWALVLAFALRVAVIRLPENSQVEMYKYDQKLKEAYQG